MEPNYKEICETILKIPERDFADYDAPVEYNNEEASAWRSGFNSAREQIRRIMLKHGIKEAE